MVDHLKKVFLIFAGLVFILGLLPHPALAQHGHGPEKKGEPMKMDTKEVLVEGIKITFAIMSNKEHKKMLADMKVKEEPETGTTHNITVTLKDGSTDKEITEAKVSMKVVNPRGKDQIKALKYEEKMKSYHGYFNLEEKGKYQILVLLMTGGQKRTAGIHYEIK